MEYLKNKKLLIGVSLLLFLTFVSMSNKSNDTPLSEIDITSNFNIEIVNKYGQTFYVLTDRSGSPIQFLKL